jgi:hypothetical protein
VRTAQDLDAMLWNLLGTGERFPDGRKKLNVYYAKLQTGTSPAERFKQATTNR